MLSRSHKRHPNRLTYDTPVRMLGPSVDTKQPSKEPYATNVVEGRFSEVQMQDSA